jgi:histidinol-phosphate aminotransferase
MPKPCVCGCANHKLQTTNFNLMFDLNKLVRPNIRALKPYSSARSEFSGVASVFLDANENSFGSPLTKWYNRYPDPLQWDLKKKIAGIKHVPAEQMLLGNGSDECIDLLIRAFCEPALDAVLICPPTYGMYEVYAHVNNVAVQEVPLLPDFQLNLEGIEAAITAQTKIIFICSPNNPTGNSIDREDIEIILNNFDGLVVVDEAYINYSRSRSFLPALKDYPNLVVLQTFSKAWGLAALRLGVTYAAPEIIDVLNKIKPPYNINAATQEIALKALDKLGEVNAMIQETVEERSTLISQLADVPGVQKIFPTDANFVLVRFSEATKVYEYLRDQGIIVRNRSNVLLCDDCLRITVGTPEQNQQLIKTLNAYPNG